MPKHFICQPCFSILQTVDKHKNVRLIVNSSFSNIADWTAVGCYCFQIIVLKNESQSKQVKQFHMVIKNEVKHRTKIFKLFS